MIWKEKGVEEGSHICFFQTSDQFQKYFYYMVSCGNFQCNNEYSVSDKGTRPPIFFYLVSGSLEIDYQNCHYTAHANDIVLLNCFHKQRYYCTENTEFLFFHYHGKDAIALTDALIENNHSPIFHLEHAKEIFMDINPPIMKLCFQEQISTSALSALVYSALCRLLDENAVSTITPEGEGHLISEIAVRYINDHIQKQFTLQELADCVNLSPFYFSRLFKKEIGHSPLDYVSITKINYAKMMLRTTTLSITEIGESLGYSSSASFINAFKLRRGMTPKKYRDYINFTMKDTTAAHPE